MNSSSQTSTHEHYDVLVIGSGAGGKIARPAANLGLRVAYIEKGPMGGTCLNRGCIPSKMLIHVADIISEIQESTKFPIHGIDVKNVLVDRSNLVKHVCNEIDGESNTIEDAVSKHSGVTLIRGHVTFVDTHKVKVNEKVVSADKIFVAAGCRANVPDIPGLDGTPYLTYTEALRLQSSPKSMIVLGGGYIATELGYYFGQTGTKVDFLLRGDVMLREEDDNVREEFERAFGARFPVWYGVKYDRVAYQDGMFVVDVTVVGRDGRSTASSAVGSDQVMIGKRKFVAESLLVATGVRPNTDTLRTDLAGIQTDARGYITVDKNLRTSQSHIWAFGDIIGRYLFRHTANYEGSWLFQHVFADRLGINSKNENGIKYPPIPHAVFSNPQIGGVGMTELEARSAYGSKGYIVGRCDYADCAMGNAMRVDHGFCKLIFRVPATSRVSDADAQLVGAHVIGREASTLVHMLIAYMRMHATLADLLDTIYIHPALPEVVRDAARDASENLSSIQ